MKARMIILLLLTFFLSPQAFSGVSFMGTAQIPISLENVVIAEDGIYLNVEGSLYRLSAVFEEEDGFYALPSPNLWFCKTCKHHNLYPAKRCLWCGTSRVESKDPEKQPSSSP